jgi:F-type H+-transporting ATPase subunit b
MPLLMSVSGLSNARPLLASGADVNVDFDYSFLVQLVLFGAFIVLLKPIVFDPMLRLFEERERRTEGVRKRAREMDEKAAAFFQKYEAAMETVRREAAQEREHLRAETAKLEARILDEAKVETQRILDEGNAAIATEVARLRTELEAARPALAAQIASKLLGREVQS